MESRLTPWNVRLAPPPLHLHAGRTNLTPGLGTPAVDRDQRARIGLLVALGETAGTRRPGEFVPECSCAGGISGPCGMKLFHPLGLATTALSELTPRCVADHAQNRVAAGDQRLGHASAVKQFQRPDPHPNASDVPDRSARGGEHLPDGPRCPESSLIWLRSRRAAAPVSSSTAPQPAHPGCAHRGRSAAATHLGAPTAGLGHREPGQLILHRRTPPASATVNARRCGTLT